MSCGEWNGNHHFPSPASDGVTCQQSVQSFLRLLPWGQGISSGCTVVGGHGRVWGRQASVRQRKPSAALLPAPCPSTESFSCANGHSSLVSWNQLR